MEELAPSHNEGRGRILAIMTAISSSVFLAGLDMTIIATAIPTITGDLHSAAGYTWIGSAYMIGYAAGSCIWANLSDIWGRRPILLIVVAWFFASSLICAMAVNISMLIAGRALQGVAGGGLIQLGTIVISDLFSVRHRSLYLGALEIAWVVSGGVGPVLGGAFSEHVSWRWCFWINLPICGVAFVLLLFMNVHNPKTKMVDGIQAVDWCGIITILGFILMLLLGLDFGGETFPWGSPTVICLIIFGFVCFLAFLGCEKYLAKYPLVPFRAFSHPSNMATLVVLFVHGFVFIAGDYYVPLYLQSVLEVSPMWSGIYILPSAVTEGVASMLAAVMIRYTGRYEELIWLGLAVMTLGNGLHIRLDASSTVGEVIAYRVISCVGSGLLFQPPIVAIQARVSQEMTAMATATAGVVLSLANSCSVVIGGVIFQNSMRRMSSRFLAVGLPESIAARLTGGSAAANIQLIQTITDAQQRQTVKEVFSWSLRNMWIVYTSVSILGMLLGVLIKKTTLNEGHIETQTGLKREDYVQPSIL
ncbi:hypothetical protein FE257_002542 [Aspergillus nanangensis]|uniref:Major facilitator superfamily (MFS) profile domain-containing protein n=1 Tax=Aspergillus nanangensis TaxID=2582783 RepID=A0AAD4GWS1_ASPNN|nr:hypothetical protein FE257_002542 [Aspergillus nanangensis]